MILEFEGRTHDIDVKKVSVDEWRELKRKYRMTPKSFEEGMAEADPDASTFLYWIMLRREGQMTIPLGDNLKPDILALNEAIHAAKSDDDEDQDEEPEPEVPTSPPGSAASPAPSSRPTMTPQPSPPASSLPAAANGGTATSNGYARSTSARSLTSATSTSPTSASSP